MLRYAQSALMPTFIIMIISIFAFIHSFYPFSPSPSVCAPLLALPAACIISSWLHWLRCFLHLLASRAGAGAVPGAGGLSAKFWEVLGFGPEARALALLRRNCSCRPPSG